jgi:hypothetical protein
MRAREDGDEGVIELLGRRVAHRLLRDVDVRGDSLLEAEPSEPEAKSGQRCARGEVRWSKLSWCPS